jgi:hypothetical protein
VLSAHAVLWVPARLLQYKLSVIHMLECSDHLWISGRRLLCSVNISERSEVNPAGTTVLLITEDTYDVPPPREVVMMNDEVHETIH